MGIGIGRPLSHDKAAVGTYVMQSFSEEEFKELLESYEQIYEEFIKPFVPNSEQTTQDAVIPWFILNNNPYSNILLC